MNSGDIDKLRRGEPTKCPRCGSVRIEPSMTSPRIWSCNYEACGHEWRVASASPAGAKGER